jgi:ATP-dependent RNA helicase DeaD
MTLKKKRSHPLGGEINKLILASGFRQPAQLQEKLIPLILSGKDVYVEADEQRGKSLSLAISFIFRLKRADKGIKALVITESAETAHKLKQAMKRIAALRSQKLSVMLVGFTDLIKKEGRGLSGSPDIVIGSSARTIDHIRRGHVDFSQIEMTCIDEPANNTQEFLNDIFFIFSKLPPQKQTIYFATSQGEAENDLLSLLKRPVTLQKTDFYSDTLVLEHSYLVTEHKTTAVKALVIARQIDALLILCRTASECRKLEKELKASHLKAVHVANSLPNEKISRYLDSFNVGKKSILIVSFPEIKAINPEGISCIINYDLPDTPDEYREICTPHIIGTNCTHILNLVTEQQNKDITKIEEICNMKMKQEQFPKDEEILKGFLNTVVKKIKQEENPLELEYYKKIVKKNVSLFDRSYLMAYFVRNALKKLPAKKANFTTLFVSVGKNRRIFRRDLIKLFAAALNLKEADIGEVKILENYSFIDIPATYAVKAIDRLNNTDFKGRRITVNFSRKKSEKKPVAARKTRQFR